MADWDRARVAGAFDVSRETLDRFETYLGLLETWRRRLNLTGRATAADMWGRHIADSLQVIPLAPGHARVWLDLGSGAGAPGLVIAIALRGRPGLEMHLVEANARKCGFLELAAARTGAPAVIHNCRVEELARSDDRPRPDVITARAFAPLSRLVPLAVPLMWKNTVLLLHKGQDVERELTEAAISSTMTVDRRASVTDPAATILRLEEARGDGA